LSVFKKKKEFKTNKSFFCVFNEEPKTIAVCVHFNKIISKYVGQIRHQKNAYYCGCFSNELEAAQAVNLKCVELNIPLKNPELGLPENKPEVRYISNKQNATKSVH
jgi:hypothetical protein